VFRVGRPGRLAAGSPPPAAVPFDLPPEFFAFVAVGLAAQLVDGALGMAYGVTSASLLMALGLPPATASASVHAAEVATTGVSGLSHGLFGNVDRRLLRSLVLPGVLGAVAGAFLLSLADWAWLRPLVAAYLLGLGLLILWRAWRGRRGEHRPGRYLPLGLAAGFLDAVGGGGWGPLTTSHLVARHLPPRIAIGTANVAEFFVSLAVTVVFLGTLGISHVPVVAGLLVGGVLAAPLSAWLASRIPARPLMAVVGLLVSGVSLYNLLR